MLLSLFEYVFKIIKTYLEISTYHWTEIETEEAGSNYNFPQLEPEKFDQELYLS